MPKKKVFTGFRPPCFLENNSIQTYRCRISRLVVGWLSGSGGGGVGDNAWAVKEVLITVAKDFARYYNIPHVQAAARVFFPLLSLTYPPPTLVTHPTPLPTPDPCVAARQNAISIGECARGHRVPTIRPYLYKSDLWKITGELNFWNRKSL